MKRTFFLWIALIVLFLSVRGTAEAACSARPISGCPSGTIQCMVGNTNIPSSSCCTAASECIGGVAATPVPTRPTVRSSGVQDPKMCDFIADAGEKTRCKNCFSNQDGAWTALGCIKTTPDGFIKQFLGLGISMGGGIAFLLILFGGFQMMTSAGNPERLTAGKELVGAAISGLLLIILSIFLLRLIGFEILRIPGFG